MNQIGKIDSDLLQVFVEARIHEQLKESKEKFMSKTVLLTFLVASVLIGCESRPIQQNVSGLFVMLGTPYVR